MQIEQDVYRVIIGVIQRDVELVILVTHKLFAHFVIILVTGITVIVILLVMVTLIVLLVMLLVTKM